MLRMFGRAVRAHQLYLHNNPTYLKALETARASFAPIWAHTDEVRLDVSDTQLTWEGKVVVSEPDKTSDALPWVLYKDGIRELRFLRGIEQAEIIDLVDVIARVRKAQGDEDDLLTLLWEREFNFIRHRYVDLSVDGVIPLEVSEEALRERLVDPSEVKAPPREELPGVVSMDDFNTTLYFLDESEIEYLRDEVAREYSSDLRENVVSVLLDIYEQQVDEAVRDEVATHLDTLLVTLLTSGRYGAVAGLLREVDSTVARARELTPTQRTRLEALAERLSDPEPLGQLLQSLDERSELVGQQELDALFVQLRVQALGTIFAWLGRVQNPRVRSQLETAAQRLAAANTSELVRLIASPDREVSLEAVRRSGAMRAAAAVPGLTRLLAQQDANVRLAAVVALSEIATPGALQQLEKTLDDQSREVRVASARAFAARMHRPALSRLESIISERRTSGADLTEKMAVFEAYGTMCGDAGVNLLDGMLNGRGLFGKREDAETRACAAMALGRIGSPSALGSLQKASTDKEILVRNAVNRALRGGGPGGVT
ncbi:MAG: HEAT repeat domain-containing protein [Gemmatimonadota bacterium]